MADPATRIREDDTPVVTQLKARITELEQQLADLDLRAVEALTRTWAAERERDQLAATLRQVRDNAESWHGDDAAKARALDVIARWCRAALDRHTQEPT